MPDNLNNMSPWFKLFALSIVGGVAKALFAPTRSLPPVINQTIERATDAAIDSAKKGGAHA